MSRKQSAAMDRALRLVARGSSISGSARKQGLAISSVRRALRALGEPPHRAGRPPSTPSS